MSFFKQEKESNEHSLRILSDLREYDDFMDSVRTVCDMGCGLGHDIYWWATQENPDDGTLYNYKCFGVDRLKRQISRNQHPNITYATADQSTYKPADYIDILWSHDAFQYAKDPIATMKHWNSIMNPGGMIILSVPETAGLFYNRLRYRVPSQTLYHWSAINLTYLLAASGFDCSDGHCWREDNYITMVAYKGEHPAKNPFDVDWYQLVELGVVSPSIAQSIKMHGEVLQEKIIWNWITGKKSLMP